MSLPLDVSSFNRDASLVTLEKQLICPLCLEVFTKPVVILPCQHNICRKCANELYQTELTDGIGPLVASNERIQACINDLEEICSSIEENSRKQKQILCEKFDRMCGILEERRKIMVQRITYEQDEKTSWAQSLVHTYSEHVDTNSKLVQTALNAMEEMEMAAFLQTSKNLIEQVSEATKSAPVETIEPGFENMDHYMVDFNAEERALYQLDFIQLEGEGEAPPEELAPEEPEPDVFPEPETEPEPEPEPEPEYEPLHDLVENSEPDNELGMKTEHFEIQNILSQTKEKNQSQVVGCSARQKEKVICEKSGLSTQQAIIHTFYVLALLVILQRLWGNIQCLFFI